MDSCGCLGCETADDTAAGTQVFDVCGDGLDNDGNGETDELGCVRAWVGGESDLGQLGKVLAVATNDMALWSSAAEDASSFDSVVGLYLGPGSALLDLWSLEPEPRYDSHQALLASGDESVLVSSTGSADVGYRIETFSLPGIARAGSPPEMLSTNGLDCDGQSWSVRSLDAWPNDAAVDVAVGLGCGEVLVAKDVWSSEGQLEYAADAALSFGDDPENEHQFGWGVGFVPDDGGDGIPEVAVGAPGPYDSQFRSASGSAVYIFDGTLSGSLTSADADAVVADPDSAGYADHIGRMSDLDGDGHDDLVIDSDGAVQLWFGPFSGTMLVEDVKIVSAHGLAGQFSVNGDEWPDLAVGGYGDEVRLFAGPIERATFEVEDADYTIPTPWLEWTARSTMIFADADADGTNELIVGAPDFGSEGSTPGPGLIAVFDLTGW